MGGAKDMVRKGFGDGTDPNWSTGWDVLSETLAIRSQPGWDRGKIEIVDLLSHTI